MLVDRRPQLGQVHQVKNLKTSTPNASCDYHNHSGPGYRAICHGREPNRVGTCLSDLQRMLAVCYCLENISFSPTNHLDPDTSPHPCPHTNQDVSSPSSLSTVLQSMGLNCSKATPRQVCECSLHVTVNISLVLFAQFCSLSQFCLSNNRLPQVAKVLRMRLRTVMKGGPQHVLGQPIKAR